MRILTMKLVKIIACSIIIYFLLTNHLKKYNWI